MTCCFAFVFPTKSRRISLHVSKKKQCSLCMDCCWLLKTNTFGIQLLDIETLFYSFNAGLAKRTYTNSMFSRVSKNSTIVKNTNQVADGYHLKLDYSDIILQQGVLIKSPLLHSAFGICIEFLSRISSLFTKIIVLSFCLLLLKPTSQIAGPVWRDSKLGYIKRTSGL
jgi:hypothetical protein